MSRESEWVEVRRGNAALGCLVLLLAVACFVWPASWPWFLLATGCCLLVELGRPSPTRRAAVESAEPAAAVVAAPPEGVVEVEAETLPELEILDCADPPDWRFVLGSERTLAYEGDRRLVLARGPLEFALQVAVESVAEDVCFSDVLRVRKLVTDCAGGRHAIDSFLSAEDLWDLILREGSLSQAVFQARLRAGIRARVFSVQRGIELRSDARKTRVLHVQHERESDALEVRTKLFGASIDLLHVHRQDEAAPRAIDSELFARLVLHQPVESIRRSVDTPAGLVVYARLPIDSALWRNWRELRSEPGDVEKRWWPDPAARVEGRPSQIGSARPQPSVELLE